MNYYIDTEFLEGTQKYGQPWLNFWLGQKAKEKPTIDLISIGIVSEDGREYYAISKDFNLREAWDRYEWYSTAYNKPARNKAEEDFKVYWIRENVLRSIWNELCTFHINNANHKHFGQPITDTRILKFNYKNFKWLINKYGKTNQQIAEKVKEFISYPQDIEDSVAMLQKRSPIDKSPKFYGYFADYDWVAFCWLFGKMNNLPNGFPKYCRDLKQMFDEKVSVYEDRFMNGNEDFETRMSYVMNKDNYPKQINEHNAIADARWNKELHEFIKTL
jgi:hypothetical protein